MAGAINVGAIQADLQLNSGNLERGLANARKAMSTMERELKQLDEDVQRGAISLQDYYTQWRAVVAVMSQLQGSMRTAHAAFTQTGNALGLINAGATQAAAGMGKAAGGSGALARGMMQVGYVMDDLQYGFAGVVNNISPLVYSFSTAAGASTAMASGIAAATQVLVVAGYQAYTHWDDFMDLLGQGIPTPAIEGVEGLKNELKEVEKVIDALHDKKRLNLIDLKNLEEQENRAKILKEQIKEEKDLEDLAGQTKEEKARGSAFDDAVKTQGGDKVKELLKGHFAEQAETEGQSLDREQLKDLIKGQSLDLSEDLTAEQVESLGKALNIDFDFAKMQDRKDQGDPAADGDGMYGTDLLGPIAMIGRRYEESTKAPLDKSYSINSQILEQLSKQKFLYDESGNARTPEGMAKDTLLRGTRGEKNAADLVAAVTNKGEGDPDGFTMSPFSKSYLDASPEGKKAAKDAETKEKLEAAEKKKQDAAQKKADAEAKKAAKDADDQLDAQFAAFDASTAEWKKYKARRDKWVKDQVDALKGGELGQAAIAGTLTEDQTKDRLLKMGLDKDKVESAYEDVHRGLEISAGKTIAGRVAETGEDRDTAAANLAREDREKRRKENADLAAKAIPGLDKAIEQQLTVGTAMTGNGAGVAAGIRDQVRQLLINAGIDPSAAANQASAAVEEGGNRVNKNIAEEAMDQQDKANQRKSVDVFDSASLASKLQGSVGDAEAKKQTTALEKSLGYLATIAGQTGTTIKFTK